MIPKIIHYCWLSDEPFPDMVRECIDSWKRILPDYEIIKWDRSRFDVNSVPWVKEAYAAKKYAFCADYIRIYALYTMGGIYLDSDVMVYQTFTPFLSCSSFSSYEFHAYNMYARIKNKKENTVGIQAAIIGAQKGEEWLKKTLDFYNNTNFRVDNSSLMLNTMPKVIARVLSKNYGMVYVPKYQKLSNDFEIFPCEVFASRETPPLLITYARHLGANAWGANKESRVKMWLKELLMKMGMLENIRKMRGIGPHI